MDVQGTNHGGNRRGAMGAALRRTTREFVELVGLEPESVTAVDRVDGGWRFRLEVEEMERIPPTTSVLASYEVTADRKGEILGFRRVRRYLRSQTEG